VIALLAGERADRGGVGARIRLGHTEGDVQVAARDARQVLLLHLLRAVLHDRVHAKDRQMHCGRAVHRRPRCGDFLEYERRLGDAAPAAAIDLRNGDADPARLCERTVELPRKAMIGVAARPVLVGEVGADLAHRGTDEHVLFGLLELHG